jgi:AmiR/NasT family two-component response regulator
MPSDERRLTVVLAEDDFLVSREVVRTAEAAGLAIVGVAGDGAEAVALVRQHSPDVAILDIEMPRESGLVAAARIREEHPTPVVILTAYETPEFVSAAVEAGVGAYVTKPPDPAGLRRAVEISVARHADLRELQRLNAELRRALGEIKTLERMLSICAQCKRIRTGEGGWQPLEAYLHEHADVRFSHGLCPECARAQLRDLS